MGRSPGESFRGSLASLDPKAATYASDVVARLLDEARAARASDIHLAPSGDGLEILWRIDGVLHQIALLPPAVAGNVVARLKILAELLTYRNDTPQEGRIRTTPGGVETRVSTFPTLHGERVVVRLFAANQTYARLDGLGLPGDVVDALRGWLAETSGMVILAGPAGSGKTTTLYACLREITAMTRGARSLATLEDPVESAIPGVSQAQVNPAAGFTLETGLRSLLRQDPEVIAVGEIRDRAVAEVAFQAALTGHLVLTTFHAGSAAGALSRLADLGIEPYLIRGGLRAVVFQRLARRLCSCATPTEDPADFLGLSVRSASRPVGCDLCDQAGYRGRILLSEIALPDHGRLARAVQAREDATALERAALADGQVDRWQRAVAAIESAQTTPAEVRRTLGLGFSPGSDMRH